MTAGTEIVKPTPLILAQIERAQGAARRLFRLKFFATWLVIIAGVAAFIYVTGNADPNWLAINAPFILGGAGLTILISLASIVLATVLALVGALGRLSRSPFINGAASLYVSLVRGTPLLVQIYVIFYALPQLGLVLDPIPSGILALGFNYGAYMTEIFRAGIQAVPRGQREAAQALGMPEPLVLRRIVLPQATRIVIPAIGNEFIAMIKDSSLVSFLGLQELLWRAQTFGRRDQQIIQSLLLAAFIYWGLTMLFSFFQERLERRMARGDR
jgi:polar amino acid transport system permease protein